MGDSFTHEFSMSGVDTGRTTPSQQRTIQVPQGGSIDAISAGGTQPQTVTVPGQPIMRPSFLQAFLANLGPALAGGLASEPGMPFGTGLGGALKGIQDFKQKQFQMGLQQQQSQINQQLAQSTLAGQAEALKQAQQVNPLDVQEKKLNLQRQQGIIDLVNKPGGIDQIVQPMTQSLGKLDENEQAQIDAAKQEVTANLRQGKFDVAPMQQAVTKIAQERAIYDRSSARVDRQVFEGFMQNPPPGYKANPVDFARWKASLNPIATMGKFGIERADTSYKLNSEALDKVAKPIEDTMARMSRLRDTIAQNSPQADALVAPELLTVMAGGQGSGLRMNEAEISRIVGGRNKWQDLQSKIAAYQADPSKPFLITPEQRNQVSRLINAVNSKLVAKQAIIDQSRNALLGTDNPKDHRSIVVKARNQINQVDQQKQDSNQPKPTHRYNPETGKIEPL